MSQLNSQVDRTIDEADQARALHRVVRAIHDGHCPQCGHLGSSEDFLGYHCHKCPRCGFEISDMEAEAALKKFHTFMERNLQIYLSWREEWQRNPT